MKAQDRLATYRAKRDPARTPEPFGGARGTDGGRFFMVHKHAARRLHYDLRLEMGGVLASWAVPKGPPASPKDKRLAVHVEDHPLEYGDFEGMIPEGNYGAGPSIVWDRGVYRLVGDADPLEAVERGKLDLEFFGFKLRGRFALVRTARGEKDWLLIKKADAAVSDVELTERYPESVLSGLTIEEVREGASRLAQVRAYLRKIKAPRGGVTAREAGVMLATLVDEVPEGPGWLFEIKYDGVRVLAVRRDGSVKLYGRSGQLVTGRYPEIARALAALPVDDFVIDGEIVALDEANRPSFQLLQSRMGLTDPRDVERAMGEVPVTGVFFDCLAVDGHDLRGLPLAARKDGLKLFLPARGVASYGEHVTEQGREFHRAACDQGLEGVMAKRADSRYTGARTRDWLKIKCQLRQELVIGGYTKPQGSRARFGALHLGVHDKGRLVYVGKVGTGFDAKTLESVYHALRPLERPTSPFDVGAPGGGGHHWVEPRLVVEVRFTEWTRDGGIRHPAFLGLRTDKAPGSITRERPTQAPPPASGAGRERGAGQSTRPDSSHPAGAVTSAPEAGPAPKVRLTNLGKVFWPDEGYTKGDLVAYYDTIAPLILPYLRDRPLVLTRHPDGIAGKSFYQKDAPPFAPDWLRTVRIRSEESARDIDYFVVDDADGLRYLINSGVIPIHVWASRAGSLDHPDWLVLDLDPKEAPFGDVVKVARVIHDLLDDLGLPGCVKTSGATGLHILLPLDARYTYEQTRGFAHVLAAVAVEQAGDIATVARPLRARGGKVYVDWGQNGKGQTIAAPFAVRPRPGATVSCPLRWDEVTARLHPARFTIKTVPERFASMADPLAPVLGEGIDMAAAIAALERRQAGPERGRKRARTRR
ncbi:MAG: DNA ligase D [Candidatus Rokubacteria bacterium]|nr:DNA ligase D [Candidatus Rokubacteria bacterium]